MFDYLVWYRRWCSRGLFSAHPGHRSEGRVPVGEVQVGLCSGVGGQEGQGRPPVTLTRRVGPLVTLTSLYLYEDASGPVLVTFRTRTFPENQCYNLNFTSLKCKIKSHSIDPLRRNVKHFLTRRVLERNGGGFGGP